MEDAIVTAEDSRRAASIIGLLGLLWAGLAVVGAHAGRLQRRVAGHRPRAARPRSSPSRWLLGAGTLFLVTAALGPALSWLPGVLVPVNVLVGARPHHRCSSCWTYSTLGNNTVGWRVHLPGALARGGRLRDPQGRRRGVPAPRSISGSSALYGSIGVVFATLAWLAIYARLIVYGAALNVVRYEASGRHRHRRDRGATHRGRGAADRHPRRCGGRARRVRSD